MQLVDLQILCEWVYAQTTKQENLQGQLKADPRKS